MNVVTFFDNRASLNRDLVAIHHGRKNITYGELHDQSLKGGEFLLEKGLKRGDTVLIFVPMSIDLYVILVSLWRQGMIAMFVDPSSDGTTLSTCCQRAQPRGFIGTPTAQFLRITKRAFRSLSPAITTGWLPFMNRWSEIRRLPGNISCVDCPADTPALITFTSGSTGIPKGTVRTHGFLAAQKNVLQKTLNLTAGNSDLATLPIFALINLACGVSTIIPPVSLKKPAAIMTSPVLEEIKRLKPVTAVASPAFFERLLSDPARNELRCLKALFTGGAPVFPRLLKRLADCLPSTKITAVYGSTEAEPIAEIEYSEISGSDFKKMSEGAGLLAGKVIPQIECRIIENNWGIPIGPFSPAEFQETSQGAHVPGEIVVHGEHVLKGYLGGDGDLVNKFSVGTDVWHRTGDIGYFDGSGRLWLLGRCSAVIDDTRGVVYPFAVETAALQQKKVSRAAFCQLDNRRVLVIETNEDFAKIQHALKAVVEIFQIDHLVKLTVPMDRRHNGKVDYPLLLKKLAAKKA
jgi:acyl-CoA synthetase (AMP-forming)/AMP-acid ligase II